MRLRAELGGAGTPIGPYDVVIAGQALSRDMTLVTRNLREFPRVPELRLEDWES
ncbi:MAG: PIN domain-containing protein [Allorhizobium sp.]